jgi:hypothetical protein
MHQQNATACLIAATHVMNVVIVDIAVGGGKGNILVYSSAQNLDTTGADVRNLVIFNTHVVTALGNLNGVNYDLISADKLDFKLMKIR